MGRDAIFGNERSAGPVRVSSFAYRTRETVPAIWRLVPGADGPEQRAVPRRAN